jgi:hypothetical protein
LRLATDYAVSKDAASKGELTKINEAIKKATGGDPSKIVDGYLLTGAAYGTKSTPDFFAPLGAAAVFDAGNQAWADGLWKAMAAAGAAGNGGSDVDSINLLGMLVMSGNWWAP